MNHSYGNAGPMVAERALAPAESTRDRSFKIGPVGPAIDFGRVTFDDGTGHVTVDVSFVDGTRNSFNNLYGDALLPADPYGALALDEYAAGELAKVLRMAMGDFSDISSFLVPAAKCSNPCSVPFLLNGAGGLQKRLVLSRASATNFPIVMAKPVSRQESLPSDRGRAWMCANAYCYARNCRRRRPARLARMSDVQ